MSSADYPSIQTLLGSIEQSGQEAAVKAKADQYLRYFDENRNEEETRKLRRENALDVSNQYYDLATDFYEYGWGEGFHFARLRSGESRDLSWAKYEYTLALKLALVPQDLVLDAGCGIGGPARSIAEFSGAKVVGINCNEYQLKRARELTQRAKLEHLCSFDKGDFHSLKYADGFFDKAYAIEATCHSRNLADVYSEMYRVLKPGGRFAVYEWVMTDKYNPGNPRHRKLKEDILEGDGLYDVASIAQVHAAVKQSGFELIEAVDRAEDAELPWYSVLQGRWTLAAVRATPLGRWLTHLMLTALETLGLAPRGSVLVHRTLRKGADALAAAGVEGIFSPMYLIVLRKPAAA